MLWIVNSSSVDPPSLVLAVVALVPDSVSVVVVVTSMNIKASVSEISDVSHGSSEPSNALELILSVSVWSNDGSVVVVVPVVTIVLDRDGVSSVASWSDGSSSPVEDEPLSQVSS